MTQRPGTYGVVVTPESFSDLPEYAATAPPSSRRMSEQSRRRSVGSPGPSFSQSSSRVDPNFVVLNRFEDPLPAASAPSHIHSPTRRPSFPDALQQLSISSSPQTTIPTYPATPISRVVSADDHFITHFRRYIVRRLVQPLSDIQARDAVVLGSTRDVFEVEAARFPPVSLMVLVHGSAG